MDHNFSKLQRLWWNQWRADWIRVEHFPGFTTLQFYGKVTDLLSSFGEEPEIFTGRIIFMSMFNDISCGTKDNEEECLANARLVSLYARRFGTGQWSFIGPGSEKKWYSIKVDSPPCVCGSRDNEKECGSNAQLVSLNAKRFRIGQWSFLVPGSEQKWYTLSVKIVQKENRTKWQSKWCWHPQKADTQSSVPRVHCPEECLKARVVARGDGKLSIHYCADLETITTVFRTIISVNQLSLYVAEICEEYETFHDRTGQPVVGGNRVPHSCQLWSRQKCFWIVMTVLTKIFYCNNMENELKSYHNKTNWVNSVWMQDFWMLLKSDSISRRKTLETWHNFMQWPVVNTLFQDMMDHHNQKDGSEGTPKLGPYWKLQPVACMINIKWTSEFGLLTKTILTLGLEFLMDQINLWWIRMTTTQKFQKISSKNMRYNWIRKILHADQRRKQNHKEENLLALHLEPFRWTEGIVLILNQGNILSLRTKFRRK